MTVAVTELIAMNNQNFSELEVKPKVTSKDLRNFGGRRQFAAEQMPSEIDFSALFEASFPKGQRPFSGQMGIEQTASQSSHGQVPLFPPSVRPSCEYFPELPKTPQTERGLKAYISRKFANVTQPNISIKERIRSLPVIGYGMAWLNAVMKLAVTRHHHHLELVNLRAQNQMLRDDILRMHERFNHLESVLNGVQARSEEQFQGMRNCLQGTLTNLTARFDVENEKIESIKSRIQDMDRSQFDPRLRRLEMIDAGSRLMKLEQLEIARKLKQLTHLVRLSQRDQNMEVQRDSQQRADTSNSSEALTTIASKSKAEINIDLDQFYIEFEDKFRGSKQEIKQRLRAYLPYVDAFARVSDDQGRRFVDVGCGRGEWLELLGELGIPALGIDMNAAMVDACIASGCAAKVDDAIAYLQRQPAGSLAGVTGFHIIEHLPFETLIALFDAAYAALADGGVLIFETPNPENMIVGSCNFYYDPTHRNPIVPAVAEFIARQRGFSKAEILRLHPFPEDYRVKGEGFSGDLINKFFFGAQDFALIAWK
jgi:SAM-dependent methyltransferase